MDKKICKKCKETKSLLEFTTLDIGMPEIIGLCRHCEDIYLASIPIKYFNKFVA